MTGEEIRVEQIRMERFIQPFGTEIKLCMLEIPDGLVGHPYTVERQVEGRWQWRSSGLTYASAHKEYHSLRAFEESIGSKKTLLGDWSDD